MIDLKGYWYPAESSDQEETRLRLQSQNYLLLSDSSNTIQGDIGELQFSQRVGNIPRKITFPDGSVFVCEANDVIDRWLADSRHNDNQSWLFEIETRWHWVAISITLVIVFSGLFVWKGLPWISTEVADALPVDVYQKIGTGTIEGFDEWLLEESEIPAIRQAEISQRFNRLIDLAAANEYRFKIHFRQMKNVPNAFALPTGDIVITDELIKIAENDEEIDAVLLHEIGHVIERHGVQQVIHSSAISVIITLLLGDATAVANIAIAMPAFLLDSRYSRQHETEADQFALDRLLKADINPVYFANIMQKFHQYESNATEGQSPGDEGKSDQTIYDYLSSHPATESRIKLADEYIEKYRRRFPDQ